MGGIPSAASFLKYSWGRLFVRAPTRGLQLLLGSQTDRCQSVPEGSYVLHPGLHWSAHSWVNTNEGEVWLDTLSSPPSTPAAGLIGTDLAGNLLHWIVTSAVFAFDLGRAMAWGRQSMTPSTCQASLDPPGASFLERFSWEGIEPRVANGLRAAHSFTTC